MGAWQIYTEVKENALKGDWINLSKEDFLKVDFSLDDEQIVKKRN